MFSALADAAESEGSYDHSGSDDKECGHVFMEIVMMFGFSLELPCLSVISSVSFLLEAGGVLHLLQHLLLRSSFFPVLRATFLFGRAWPIEGISCWWRHIFRPSLLFVMLFLPLLGPRMSILNRLGLLCFLNLIFFRTTLNIFLHGLGLRDGLLSLVLQIVFQRCGLDVADPLLSCDQQTQDSDH